MMDELEELRNKLKTIYIFGILILVLIMILTLLIVDNFIFLPFVLIMGVIIISLISAKPRNQYRNIFKNVFVLKSLEKIFTDLHYSPRSGMPYSTIAQTNMMYMGDRYHSEDYISGKYKDIKFEQADVHIQREETSRDSNGHTTTTYVTIFKGRWMIFDFNKSFKANIQIAQKGFSNSRVNTLFGNKETLFKKVSMESEEFNKRFNVYAQNEHDAFYVITPSFMEKLENLDNLNSGKLLFCFIDNRLHIGIYDNRDSFEPGSVFNPINENLIIQNISKEIKTITQFIDKLNLENNLFKKEV